MVFCTPQVAVVLSEKVDTTVSKGVLRIFGTAVGGTLGMLSCLAPKACYYISLSQWCACWATVSPHMHASSRTMLRPPKVWCSFRCMAHVCMYPSNRPLLDGWMTCDLSF